MRRLGRRDDQGFTLIELLVTIVVLGIVLVPLSGFIVEYFRNYGDTTQRMSDSHDVQLAAAYFSQDAANAGVTSLSGATGLTPADSPSVFSFSQPSFPGTYCGQGFGIPTMTPVVLLKWTAYSTSTDAAGITTATSTPTSVLYARQSGSPSSTLHRLYCQGASNTPVTDTVVVHNLSTADAQCLTAAGATTPCSSSPAPPEVDLLITISGGTGDRVAPSAPIRLEGRRRQA